MSQKHSRRATVQTPAGSGSDAGVGATDAAGGSGGADAGGGGGSVDCHNPASWPMAWTALEDSTLAAFNRLRAQGASCQGTLFPPSHPLTMNAALRQSARCHSLDMAVNDYFAHKSQNGTTPEARMAQAGYTGTPRGEDLAAGYSDAAAVTSAQNGWMSDYGHCSAIMDPSSNDVGIGYAMHEPSKYGTYWTADFGEHN
jgi:uncharacterized protein YkwD